MKRKGNTAREERKGRGSFSAISRLFGYSSRVPFPLSICLPLMGALPPLRPQCSDTRAGGEGGMKSRVLFRDERRSQPSLSPGWGLLCIPSLFSFPPALEQSRNSSSLLVPPPTLSLHARVETAMSRSSVGRAVGTLGFNHRSGTNSVVGSNPPTCRVLPFFHSLLRRS